MRAGNADVGDTEDARWIAGGTDDSVLECEVPYEPAAVLREKASARNLFEVGTGTG